MNIRNVITACFRRISYRIASTAAAASLTVALVMPNVRAADITKANNTTTLNLAGSWVSGGPPGTGDVAVFNSTYAQSSATNLLTGAALSWGGVKITSGSNLVSIGNGAANDITIGASGVDMSGASRDFALDAFQQNVNHTWSIASGRTFTVGSRGFTQNNGAVVTISGSGTVVQQSTGAFTVGNLATFTGTLSTAADTVLTVGSGSSFSLAGTISGVGSVTKDGAGTYTLTGSTAHSGGTIVTAGTLALGAAERLANTGALTVSGGVFSLGGFAETVGVVTLTGGTITSGTLTGSSYAVQAGAVSASLAGSGGLTKTSAGTVTLSGANTYGTTTVSSGTLLVTGSGSVGSGSITVSNGALVFDRAAATIVSSSITVQGAGSAPALLNNGSGLLTVQVGTSGNITVDNGEAFAIGGSGQMRIEKSIASGAGSSLVTKVGSGTVTLTSASNAWSGGTTISEGVLQVGDGVSNGTIGSGTITITNGRLAFNRPGAYTVSETMARFTAGTTPGIENNGSGTLTLNSSGLIFESGAQLTFGGTGVGLVNGDIAPLKSSASMVKDGSGTWTFDGDNGYTGTTTVNAGTLEITGRLGTGSYAQAIAINGGVLSINTTSNQVLSGTITGAGMLLKTNSGTLTLSGSSGYSGGTTVSAGRLVGTTSSVQGAITNNAAVTFDQTTSGTYSGSMTGSGSLTKLGSGTVTLSGTTTHGGGTSVTAGRLVGTTSSLQGGITNNAAVTFDQATSGTYAGAMAGTGSLTKLGSGTVTLSGNNTFSGGSALNAGALAVGSTGALGTTGTISFGGGTLQYTAVNATDYSGRFSTAAGQQYSIDTNGRSVTLATALTSSGGSFTKLGSGTLTLSGTNTYSGGTLVSAGSLVGTTASLQGGITNNAAVTFDQATSGTYADAMTGAGSLTKLGSGTVTLSGTNTYAGGTVVSAGRLVGTTSSLQGAITNDAAVTFNQSVSGTYSGVMAGTGSLAKLGSGTVTLTGGNTYGGGTVVSAGRLVGTTSSLQGAITNNATVEFAQTSSGTYSDTMTGSGMLAKSGAGTLTVSGNNSFSGGAAINAGVLAVGSAGALGTSGTISFGGGTLQYLAANTTDYSGRFSTAAGQQYSIDTNGQNVSLGSALTSSGGSLVKLGAGALTLSGTNNYSGGTVVSAGRLVGTTSSLQGAITNNAAVEFAQALSGTYAGAMTGSGSLTKSGAGTLTLSGSNTFSGGAAIDTGVLAVGSAAALGTSGTISFGGGTLQYTAANTTDYSGRFTTAAGQQYSIDTNGQNVSLGSALTSSGGSLVKLGAGTLTLSGTNTYSGGTVVSAGSLIGTTSSLQGAITNNAAVEFAQSTNDTYAGTMTGSGSVVKSGGGTLTLSGNNGYTGATTISSGTLRVGDGGGSGLLGSGAITNNGTLVFNRVGSVTVAGGIGGSGGLVQEGTGTLVLTGTSTYAGPTVVSAGTLRTTGDGLLPSGDATVGPTGSLVLGGSETFTSIAGSGAIDLGVGTLTTGSATSTFAGSIKGNGGLTKVGPGTLTLSGSNSFTGDTTISGGTLLLGSAQALPTDAVLTLASGATLQLTGTTVVGAIDSAGTVTGGTLITSLTLTQSGTLDTVIADGPNYAAGILKRTGGTTAVTAANTFTGSIKVQGGVLALSGSGSFDAASSVVMSQGATLDLGGKSQAFANLTGVGGTVALGAGTLTVATTAVDSFGGGITGSGGLVKDEVGNLILSGTSTYAGTTTVAAGRLSVNGSLGGTAVTVLSAAELGGSGSIGGPVNVQSGGSLSPGNSIASLATGTATFAAGATFEYEIDSSNPQALATAADLLVVSGDLNLDTGNGSLITLADLNPDPNWFYDGTIFALVNYSGSWNGGLFTFGATVLADGDRFTALGRDWQIDYDSPTGGVNFAGDYLPSSSFVVITAVPEPSTCIMALAGIACGGYSMWRRRKRA